MLGGTRYAPINEKLAGFATLDAGVGFISPKETSYDGVTKFAWGLRLGLRMMTSEKVSLRIHGQLMSPVQGAGGGFYFGTGGAGAGVSTYSSIYQFNFGAKRELQTEIKQTPNLFISNIYGLGADFLYFDVR